MSFRDFNDDGPGTFEWDYVLGHNTTGLFPDETHYYIDGDVLEEVIFSYTGGESWETMIGDCWNISNICRTTNGLTFEQDGIKYKAIPSMKFRSRNGLTVYDVFEVK